MEPHSAAAEPRRIRVWDLPLRLFHWSLVAVIALAFLSAEEGSPLSDWHVASGWAAAVLIAFRIAWGFVGGEHARWADFLRPSGLASHIGELLRLRPQPTLGHNPLGAVSVMVLLGLAAAVIWTGAILGEAGEEAHELLGWTLLALVGIHVLAVVAMSLLTRENLLRAMVTGRKPAERHPGAGDARRPLRFAGLAALLVLAGSIWAITAYDPRAFQLRPAEQERENDDELEHGRFAELYDDH